MAKKPFKETAVGQFLLDKIPGIVGDVLPDKGVLGIVKNLIDGDDSISDEEKSKLTSKDPVPFPEVYDIKTVKPKPEYEASLMKIKDELAGMGYPF